MSDKIVCPHYVIAHVQVPSRHQPGFRIIDRRVYLDHARVTGAPCVNPRAIGAGVTQLPPASPASMPARRKAPASLLTHVALPYRTETGRIRYHRVERTAEAVQEAREAFHG